MRRRLVVAGVLLGAAAWAAVAVARDGTGDEVAAGDSPAEATAEGACGPPPFFRAELGSTDPANVDGAAGPGPDGSPPIGGQQASHWVEDSGVVIELRWPGDRAPRGDRDFVVDTAAGMRGEGWDTDRGRTVILEAPGGAGCSALGIESTGPVTPAAVDRLAVFLDELRPRDQLDEYLAELDRSVTVAIRPDGVEPGQCAAPVPPVVDDLGYPTEAAAANLLSRFFADRAAGVGAHECLTVSGLAAFDGIDLCLFACDDGPVALEGHGPFQLGGYSGRATLASAVVEYPGGRLVRERYGVTIVHAPAGARLVVATVAGGPDSWVDDAEARALISTFLDLLAAGDFGTAAGFLYNEGVGQRVRDALGDMADDPDDLPVLLAGYCATAYCESSYAVLAQTETTERSRTYHVLFRDPEFGEQSTTFTVSAFEGQITVDGLPLELD